MEAHELLMYSYLGKYKRIEIILKEYLKLTGNLTYLDESREDHIIKEFIDKENAINKADDLMDKLKCFAKGTYLITFY